MYIRYNYKKSIILSLFKIDTLNFTMYILTILTCPLKTYVIGLHDLISMKIFFTVKDHSQYTDSQSHFRSANYMFLITRRNNLE